jgi:TctA family transporter
MRLDMDPAPLMLGFILGPMLEENFRRAMLISRGHFDVFVQRPISATLLGIIAVFIAWQFIAFLLANRKGAKPAARGHDDDAAQGKDGGGVTPQVA